MSHATDACADAGPRSYLNLHIRGLTATMAIRSLVWLSKMARKNVAYRQSAGPLGARGRGHGPRLPRLKAGTGCPKQPSLFPLRMPSALPMHITSYREMGTSL